MKKIVYGSLAAALLIVIAKLLVSSRGRFKIGSLMIGWRK